jgi:hypothetical protein
MRDVRTGSLLLALSILLTPSPSRSAEKEWLAVCGKCVSPYVFSKSGIGTSKAVAEARITVEAIREWCESWQPDDKTCVDETRKNEDLVKIYRATADCPGGKITAIDGESYTYAGVWDASDIGEGRSKWKDAKGALVGRDHASGGLSISQQWEVLCPGAATPTASAPATKSSGPFHIEKDESTGKTTFSLRLGR